MSSTLSIIRAFTVLSAVNICPHPIGFRRNGLDKTPSKLDSDIFIQPDTDVPIEVSRASQTGGTMISWPHLNDDGVFRVVSDVEYEYFPTGHQFPDGTDLIVSSILALAMKAAAGGILYESILKSWFGGSVRIFVPDSGPASSIRGPDNFMVVTSFIMKSVPD